MTLERSPSARDFIVSRFARIYPAFFVCLLVTACLRFNVDVYPGPLHVSDAFFNLPVVVGVLGQVYVDPSYWTLTLELAFYASLALTYYAIRHFSVSHTTSFWQRINHPMVWALIFWLVVGLTGRSIVGADVYTRIGLALNLKYSHMFVAGIAVYGFWQHKVRVPTVLLVAAAILGGASSWGDFSVAGSLKVLIFAAVVFGAAKVTLTGWIARLAGFLGGISYALYLIHQEMGYIVIDQLEARGINSNAAVLSALVIAILAAYLIRMYVEIPAQSFIRRKYLRWKRRQEIPCNMLQADASRRVAIEEIK